MLAEVWPVALATTVLGAVVATVLGAVVEEAVADNGSVFELCDLHGAPPDLHGVQPLQPDAQQPCLPQIPPTVQQTPLRLQRQWLHCAQRLHPHSQQ